MCPRCFPAADGRFRCAEDMADLRTVQVVEFGAQHSTRDDEERFKKSKVELDERSAIDRRPEYRGPPRHQMLAMTALSYSGHTRPARTRRVACAAVDPGQHRQHRQHHARRSLVLSVPLLFLGAAGGSRAEEPPAGGPDSEGYAGGSGNETLNTCSMNKPSCVSTMNDDPAHFVAPWEFESSIEDAVAKLCRVVEGGEYDAPVTGISNLDAAGYIAKSTVAVFSDPFPKERGVLPERPKVKRAAQSSIVRFKGTVLERSQTPGNSTYVKIRLEGEGEGSDPVETLDAEFLFLAGDSIVNVRAVSVVQPEVDGTKSGAFGLSMTQGLVMDKNVARRRMETLRRALGWSPATILTDWDPQFNAEVPTIIEKIFNPFAERNAYKPSGIPYPQDN